MGTFLWDWCAGDSGPLGCTFEGRFRAGQGALGWEAGRTADRGAGEGQAPSKMLQVLVEDGKDAAGTDAETETAPFDRTSKI